MKKLYNKGDFERPNVIKIKSIFETANKVVKSESVSITCKELNEFINKRNKDEKSSR